MAIPTQAVAALPSSAPALASSGQFVQGPGDAQEPAYRGSATFTLDGVLTSATLNWIDGTAAIPFTPSAVVINRAGGNAASTIGAQCAGFSTTTATVGFTAAGTSGNTVIVVVEIYK